ncbi:MAG: hypothetical protein A2033_12290 [Bacteroidetes bacterium GWA2_31_9]|nr:MAG: hypothetical protein A2033_12290 [Bacteroidetes bacterium GWA2_31_9]
MDSNWVKVYSFSKMHLALIAKEVLADNDIESNILNKQDSSYVVIGDIEIYVQSEDFDKALEILKTIEN